MGMHNANAKESQALAIQQPTTAVFCMQAVDITLQDATLDALPEQDGKVEQITAKACAPMVA